MRLSEVKHAEERVEIRDLLSLEIQGYGTDNLYPQRLRNITKSSGTANICVGRYGKFIRGAGFSDMNFYKFPVNRFGLKSDKLLRLISADIAQFYGFAIHVNYNALGEIVELQHIPFEHTRLGVEDDFGCVGKIAVNKHWAGKRKKRASKENTDYIDVFNPDKAVVLSQMLSNGGIDKYKGQVIWVSLDGDYTYPTPKFDSSVTEFSTDEGLANVKMRNVRNNFLPAGILITRKGTNTVQQEGIQLEFNFDMQKFKQFQGDAKACQMIGVELEHGEEAPEFKEFPARSFDKDFTVTESSTVERIYAAFEQEAFYRVRTGALGLSAEIISEAFKIYNSTTTDERLIIEETFETIFQHWHTAPPTTNFSIKELIYIDDSNGQ